MNKKLTILLPLVIFIAALGIGVVIFSSKQPQKEQPNQSSTSSMSTMSHTNTQMKEIAVRGFNTGFNPKEINLKQGEMVTIKLTSDDSPHTFTIDELGINKQFTYGKDASIVFTPNKKGTFQYYCAVPGHKEGGMIGTLTVE